MDTVISSNPPDASAFARLGKALALASGERVVFALRVPDLERTAWRDGRESALMLERRAAAAFKTVCRRTLRRGDALAHESGSDLMLAALLAPGRPTDVPRTARAVLKELSSQLAAATGCTIEEGWTIYEARRDPELALRAASAAALERGRRERERYDFFAMLGHEMRTPLTSIDGYLSAILECDLDGTTRRHFMEVAQAEAVRLRRLVEGMYALSLIDLDAEVVRAASSDAQHAIERACDAIYPVAVRRNVRLRVCSRVHAGIPLATEHAVQIFVSILENAIKHGHESGRIDVYLEERDDGLSVSFDDDGPGIPEWERSRIFEPLVRGRSATATGSGLGLAIVRATLARVGADIDVASSSLGGARFTVRFPGADSEPRSASPNEISSKVHAGTTLRSP